MIGGDVPLNVNFALSKLLFGAAVRCTLLHLYFCQSLYTLHRGLSAIAGLLIIIVLRACSVYMYICYV